MEDEWTTAAERKEWPVFVLEGYDIVAVPAPTLDRSTEKFRSSYNAEGMRRTVLACLLTHTHTHPDVLALEEDGVFRLVGGQVLPGESDKQGLHRALAEFVQKGDRRTWLSGRSSICCPFG